MFQWGPFHGRGSPDASVIDRDFAEIQLFRQGFGDDFRLAIDAHTRYSLETALEVARRLAEYHPVFFEEPVPQDQLDAYRKIAASTSIPLACGERLANFREAKPAIDTGAIQVLRPEVGNCGGILEFTRIAAYANICGVRIAPHAWCGPVVNRATTHLAATTPNLLAHRRPRAKTGGKAICWSRPPRSVTAR
jgi:galactonate dehydratase